jgi:uncharacterized membrane protein YedE/YeeE
MHSIIRPFWEPLIAGVALGTVLLLTFLLTGHGLGASGFFTLLTAWLGGEIARPATVANAYLGPFMKSAAGPLSAWISWEVIGVMLGAFVAALTAGRFRVRLDGAKNLDGLGRVALALVGGVLTGFGARLARGCTSGLGLSGGATLAVAAFLFLIGFFITGIVISRILRRAWI